MGNQQAGTNETNEQIKKTWFGLHSRAESGNDSEEKDLKQLFDFRKKSLVQKKLKIALLGNGESGKSTFFNQCMHQTNPSLYQKMVDEKSLRIHLFINMLQSIYQLYQCREELVGKEEQFLQPQSEAWKKIVELGAKNTSVLEQELEHVNLEPIAIQLEYLWRSEPLLHKIYNLRHVIGIVQSPSHLPQLLENATSYTYSSLPQKDLLHIYEKTIGKDEAQIKILDQDLILIDVGGKRDQRSQWNDLIAHSNAIIYFINLAEYRSVSTEDGQTNRLLESIDSLEKVVQRCFQVQKPLYLILSHSDAFREMIYRFDLSSVFPDVPQEMKVNSQKEWMEKANEDILRKMSSEEWIEKTKLLGSCDSFCQFVAQQREREVLAHSSSSFFLNSNLLEDAEDSSSSFRSLVIPLLEDKLWIHICKFCDHTMLATLQLVNYRMYRIAGSDIVWKTLCYASVPSKTVLLQASKLVEQSFRDYCSQQKQLQLNKKRKFLKKKWKFCFENGGMLYLGSIRFIVKKLLDWVPQQWQPFIRQNIYVCNSLDGAQVQRVMGFIANHLYWLDKREPKQQQAALAKPDLLLHEENFKASTLLSQSSSLNENNSFFTNSSSSGQDSARMILAEDSSPNMQNCDSMPTSACVTERAEVLYRFNNGNNSGNQLLGLDAVAWKESFSHLTASFLLNKHKKIDSVSSDKSLDLSSSNSTSSQEQVQPIQLQTSSVDANRHKRAMSAPTPSKEEQREKRKTIAQKLLNVQSSSGNNETDKTSTPLNQQTLSPSKAIEGIPKLQLQKLGLHKIGNRASTPENSLQHPLSNSSIASPITPASTFRYKELKVDLKNLSTPSPLLTKREINYSMREAYLIDDEFQQVFKMSKSRFYALPKWKQIELKKAVGLF